MPRALTSGMLSALSGQYLRPAVFVAMTFTSGPVFIWSGIGSIQWNSQTWVGLGSLLSLSGWEDGTTVEARGINITLSDGTHIAFPGISVYSATKSGVDRLTRVAAMESGKLGYGVRVNCIYPGLVPTAMEIGRAHV